MSAKIADQVTELHEHFNRRRQGRALKLTDDRKRKYRARLKTWKLEELKEAVDCALRDPFYLGENDRGTRYDFPESVLKDDGAVERHLERAERRVSKAQADADRPILADAQAELQVALAHRRRDQEPGDTLSAAGKAAYAASRRELDAYLEERSEERAGALRRAWEAPYLEHRRDREPARE